VTANIGGYCKFVFSMSNIRPKFLCKLTTNTHPLLLNNLKYYHECLLDKFLGVICKLRGAGIAQSV
jgi:hypothetical protein